MAPFVKGQGGRKKGSLNKTTIAKRLAEAEAALARQKELEASGQATEQRRKVSDWISSSPPWGRWHRG